MTEDNTTTVEVDVTVKKLDVKSGDMTDVVTTTAKLIKADVGLNPGDKVEDTIYISITPGADQSYDNPVISVNSSSKLTKADAG
jgi:hypothetical protein